MCIMQTECAVTDLSHLLIQAEQRLQVGEWVEAEQLCRAVLEKDIEHCEALNLLGIITLQTGRLNDAATLFARVVAARPDESGAHLNYGSVLRLLARHEEALDCCERALVISPQLPDAYNNRGNALHDLKRYPDALDSYDAALKLRPGYAEAFNNRASTLQQLGRTQEAVDSCERALALRPDFADAYYNRGNALSADRRFADAQISYERALQLSPQHAEAHLHLGSMHHELSHLDAAIESFTRALQFNPSLAAAYVSRGHTQVLLGNIQKASDDYLQALRIDPGFPGLYGVWLHTQARLCEWLDFDARIASLVASIEEGDLVTTPFFAMTLIDSPAVQLRAARNWVAVHCRASFELPTKSKQRREQPLRIGYFSADFRNHATAHLLAGVIERHDRARFCPIAFSFSVAAQDAMQDRLRAGFDNFVDVSGLSDGQVAARSRALDVDIAVDLMGFTQQQRLPLFAHRAAPLQAGYLGYPGTTGASFMDYLIADTVLIPETSQAYYSEKIAYLPNSYQANDDRRPIANYSPSREELGLPKNGVVFCCFNNPYKIVPTIFDSWMRILLTVTGSVLWLLHDSDAGAKNLRAAARARGVHDSRLVFAQRTTLPEHLARHGAADLFLDTLPVNAHTTASDALWSGLPVLTCSGESFAARVAASLLNAVGLHELVTTSLTQYEALAIDLATKPDRLAALRQQLQINRTSRPLFDTQLFTQHLETAYATMHDRYRAGLSPAHFTVRS